MILPGLITVKPEQTDIIYTLSDMVGQSFLEEGWTKELLFVLNEIGVKEERKLEISRSIIRNDFIVGAPYQCVHALPDFTAAIGGFLSSDLKGRTWDELEKEAMQLTADTVLTKTECDVLKKQMEKMAPISNFTWMIDDAKGSDFIYLFAVAVNLNNRRQGALRKVLTPFLDYAASHKIKCYLECYSDKTEEIYTHFGFENMQYLEDPAFSITERCMVKYPH